MLQIALSTYNGGKYLNEFLDSLKQQTYRDFKLIVRDDASIDDSVKILEECDLIEKLFIADKNFGVVESFNFLLKYFIDSGDEYLLFADQDDIWNKDKVEILLRNANNSYPMLIHSDLAVVDEKLNLINGSFFEYKKLNPYLNKLSDILFQNIATGCTMLINRKLASLVYPIPKEAIMHDWWIFLVASIFGEIKFLDEALLLYRQHDNNTIGASKGHLYKRYKDFCIDKYFLQAKKFLEVYGDKMDIENRDTIIKFLNLRKGNLVSRKIKFLFSNFRKHNLLENIGLFLKC